MLDKNLIGEAFVAALEMAKRVEDPIGIVGFGVVELRRAGRLIEVEPFANRITTAGDEYYARRAAAGVGPANLAQPSPLVTGMKLGTGATAATKSGAAAILGGYITGSNVALDAGFPTVAAAGSDVGWNIAYKSTWAAGVATNAAITEAALVTDQADNTNSTAAEVIARIVFAAKNKTADDTLAITWTHTFLGA